jgi:integrase
MTTKRKPSTVCSAPIDLWHWANRDQGLQAGGPICHDKKHGKAKGGLVMTKDHGTGRRWQITWTDPNGNVHRPSFERLDDAKQKRGEIDADLRARRRVRYGDDITVAQYFDKFLLGLRGTTDRRHTIESAEFAERYIKAEFGDWLLQDVHASDVTAWLGKLKTDATLVLPIIEGERNRRPRLGQSSARSCRAKLHQMYENAIEDRIVEHNPCTRKNRQAQKSKKPYVLTPAQVFAIYRAMPEHLAPAVLLGAVFGLSVGEVCGLRLADIDVEQAQIRLERMYTDEPLKTDTRGIPQRISREALEMILEPVRKRGGENVVVNAYGQPVRSKSTISMQMQRMRSVVPGLPDACVFHDFRHFYGSYLTAEGVDLTEVQKLMRHTRLSTTTDVYVNQMDTVREAGKGQQVVDNLIIAEFGSRASRAVSA